MPRRSPSRWERRQPTRSCWRTRSRAIRRASGTSRIPSTQHRGIRRPVQREQGRRRPVQGRVRAASNYRIDIYRLGYYNGTVRARSQRSILSDLVTAKSGDGRFHWARRRGQLVRLCDMWTCPPTPSPASTSPSWCERWTAAPTISPSSSATTTATRTSSSRPSDTTWQAYNDWGGNSLYSGSPAGRAYKVSYNRPINTRFDRRPGNPRISCSIRNTRRSAFSKPTATMSRTFPASTVTVGAPRSASTTSFFPSATTNTGPAGNGRTWRPRATAGVNLAFLSGNEVFWKTRWENSIAGTSTPYRTLVSYKETQPTGIDRSQLAGHRNVAGPAVRDRRGSSRRMRSPDRSSWSTTAATRTPRKGRSQFRRKTASCDSGATPASARPPRPSTPTSFPTNGTRTSTTAPGLRG